MRYINILILDILKKMADHNELNKGKFKSYRTFLKTKINEFARGKSPEAKLAEQIFKACLEKYNFFHPSRTAVVPIETWKGKTNLQIVPHIDSIDVVRFRKKDKYSKPQPFIINIPHKDLQTMIKALKNISLNLTKKIKSERIAAEYYRLKGITENKYGQPLFDENGFIWSNFFRHRIAHVTFTEIMNILDYYGLIEYLRGYTNIINLDKKINFQTEIATS